MRESKLGELKKGGTQRLNRENKKIFGENLPYWRFKPDPRYPGINKVWDRLYGDKPTSIAVYVLGYTTSDIYKDDGFAAFAKYSKDADGGYLVRRCNEKEITQHLPKNSPSYSFDPLPCIKKSGGQCDCVPAKRLIVYPCDMYVAGFMDPVILYVSKSKNDHEFITAALESAKKQLEALDRPLNGARFLLQRTTLKVPAPAFKKENGKSVLVPGVRGEKKDHFVTLVLDPAWVQQVMQEQFAAQQKLGRTSPIMLLGQDLSKQKMLPGSAVQPIAQTRAQVMEKMGDEDYYTGSTVTEVMEAEVVSDSPNGEFLPKNQDDRTNYDRLMRFCNRIKLTSQDLGLVFKNLYPNRHSSELKEEHVRAIVDECLVYWASILDRLTGVTVFQGGMPEARQMYHRHKLNEVVDEAEKADRWLQIVHEILESK